MKLSSLARDFITIIKLFKSCSRFYNHHSKGAGAALNHTRTHDLASISRLSPSGSTRIINCSVTFDPP